MSDALQFVVVTVVAGVAAVAIALPYVRRRPEGSAPCAKCASGKPCAPPDPASAPAVHPLRLVRSSSSDRQ